MNYSAHRIPSKFAAIKYLFLLEVLVFSLHGNVFVLGNEDSFEVEVNEMDDQAYDDGMAVVGRSLDSNFERENEAVEEDDYSVQDRSIDDYSIRDRNLETIEDEALDPLAAVQMINNRGFGNRKSPEMMRLERLRSDAKKSMKRQREAERANRRVERARKKMERYRKRMEYEQARAEGKARRANAHINLVEDVKINGGESDDRDEEPGRMWDPDTMRSQYRAIQDPALEKKIAPAVSAIQSRNLAPAESSFLSIGLLLLMGAIGLVITLGGVIYYWSFYYATSTLNGGFSKNEENAESIHNSSATTEDIVEVQGAPDIGVRTAAAQL